MKCAVVGLVVAAVLAVAPRALACGTPRVDAAYSARVANVLASKRDVWGERLLASPNGPSLDAARSYLHPLLYAAGRGGTRLTSSGVYYLPLTLPTSVGGERGFGLHVADGSEIIVRRAGGPRLTVGVGPTGGEGFGSCLGRLSQPSLSDGYLPILQVEYRDATGATYREESFVGRVPQSRSLVSFLRISADATRARSSVMIKVTSSKGDVQLLNVPAGRTGELDAAFVHEGARLLDATAEDYDAGREAVVAFWRDQLASSPAIEVPEPAVQDAERALLVQELELTWRYSAGNAYEELSYAEALDVAQVMAEFGYGDVARQILRYTLRRLPARFTYWRAGERLAAGAQYFRLSGERSYVAEETPSLAAVVARLARELATSGNGLLPRERYSSDIADHVYSLQGQTLVWQGLLGMGRVWTATGHRALGRRALRTAVRLERGLRRAVRGSERRLRDGSLFVPAALLDGGRPFVRLTDTRDGTYWNLVAPYALASGFFAPTGPEARGLKRYLLLHGSRLLGLVRAGAYRLGGGDGTDQVYGINVARFLADVDDADQQVLSMYGTLAAALTPGTYIAGEAASVTPLRGARYRSMYLPPNNDCAATFLEELRLLLVHESRGRRGLPRGLELAFATPRPWLEDGKRIAVAAAPTSFGPVSYAIERHGTTVGIDATLPAAPSVQLRLRLPNGEHVVRATLLGRPLRIDGSTGTIDLSGLGDRTVHVTAVVR
jgi:hypothetical protein